MRQNNSAPADQAISKSQISRLSHAFSHFKTCAVPSPPKKISLYRPGTGVSSQSLLHFGGGGVCWVFIAECGLSPASRAGGHSLAVVCGPLTVAVSLVAGYRLWSTRFRTCSHGLSSLAACGIFPNRGLNPCPLHWQAASLTLSHRESPGRQILNDWTTRKLPYYIIVEYSY